MRILKILRSIQMNFKVRLRLAHITHVELSRAIELNYRTSGRDWGKAPSAHYLCYECFNMHCETTESVVWLHYECDWVREHHVTRSIDKTCLPSQPGITLGLSPPAFPWQRHDKAASTLVVIKKVRVFPSHFTSHESFFLLS
jgi:hypothetical protein